MIRVANGEKALLQWTRGAVVISDTHCDVIRLSREDDQKAKEIAPTHVGNITRIEIPDRMLTESGYIKIECIDKAEDGERIVDRAKILIRPQQKPDGYVYGSQESGSWQALRLRMDALERAAREGKFDGKPGEDYILTEEDKQEIADLIEVDVGSREDGATFIPFVSDDGVISWTNDKGKPNPAPVNIKGVGIASVVVTESADGDNVVTVTLTDGTGAMFTVENGKDGKPGVTFTPSVSADGVLSWKNNGGQANPTAVNIKGAPGTSVTVSSASESTVDGGENIIVFSDGKTVTVRNGTKGGKGDPGTSVTVSSVSESTEDGGENVVTFSDGKSVKIKNGSKGGKGDPGDDYVLTDADKREIADLVIGETGKTEYEKVDSVEEMTDTSKMYVLSSTNTLWAYGETEPRPAYTNRADLNDTSDNSWISGYRIGSSGTSSSSTATPAPMVTNYIACATEDVVRIQGLTLGGYNVAVYKTDKTIISASKPTFPSTGVGYSAEMEGTDTYKFIITGSTVGFFRFSGVPVGTASSIVITKNEEIKMVSGYAWYDTGLSPESASGGNYLGLLEKINENKADIAEVSNRVTAMEADSGAVTIPSFWQSAVDACITKIKALQIGRDCVTFPFFSDNHQSIGYSGVLIAHVMKECGIPYAFYGGDSISSGYIEDENAMIDEDKAFDTAMSYIPNGRFCRAIGNHDGHWAVDADNKHYYTDAQNYELFLREESVAQNKHFGGDGTYYYVDDIASKVRFVVLDTNDGEVEAEQIAWLRDEALTFGELGWAVVMISHQPISNHYHALVDNAAEVISVVNASGVDIIGWFSGHIHRDRIYTGIAVNTSDDTEGDPLGFVQVTITSDNTSIAYDDATKHPTANDDKSHAIDFVTINRDTRTVNLTRLGIGADRSYTYTAAENPYEPVGDYVLTDADKSEIADVVIAKLPVYNGEVASL